MVIVVVVEKQVLVVLLVVVVLILVLVEYNVLNEAQQESLYNLNNHPGQYRIHVLPIRILLLIQEHRRLRIDQPFMYHCQRLSMNVILINT